MMLKNILFLILLSLVSQSVTGQGQSEWNQFRGSSALTGVTTATLPTSLSVLWSFKTGDNIKASPVISKGIIVVGSTDCCFYGLSTKGKLLWKFKTENSIEAPRVDYRRNCLCRKSGRNAICARSENGKTKMEVHNRGTDYGSSRILAIGQ